MISIPTLPKNKNIFNFKCTGNCPKFIKNLIEELVKITLCYEKIKSNEIIIDIVICTKDEMRDHNNNFASKNEPTDILSICQHENLKITPNTKIMLGTMLVCLDIIKQDAEFLKRPYIKHLSHIIIHATLHLLGYDHDEEERRKQMEAKEVMVLGKIGVESPYLILDQRQKQRDFFNQNS